jgi:diguanylate cyclase (GGDEF)-like protein/PAS domain S-box-containing protein
MEMHALLERQLRRLGIDPQTPPTGPDAWQELLQRVSRAYEENDRERYLLERSQELASKETSQLYAALRAERDQLDRRVQERTEALLLSEGRLSSLLSLSADWIWELDEQLRFVFISEGLEQATGIHPSELLGRKRMAEWADSDWQAAPEDLAVYHDCVETRRAFRDFTVRVRRQDGQRRHIRMSGEPVFDPEGRFRGYRGVARDVTSAVIAEQRVQQLARFDSLTGLPNRNMFLSELERAIARSRRKDESFALCFIDLDRFKTINDTLGHDAGDELLKLMAQRLHSSLRESDLVARLGGDEFVVLVEPCGDASTLTALANKLLAAISQPGSLHGCTFLVTGSVGIGIHPQDGSDAPTLLKHADAAMYLAKERGKNNVQFYTAELAELAAQQFEMESALRLALARDELCLHFQPKVDVHDGTMLGMEALVRWQRPLRGLVPPDEFIPLAEERGLIVPIGRWVMRAACRQIHAWRQAGLEPPPVAVNLSARQFADESLLDDLRRSLERYGVRPRDLEVELTESALMSDPERASAVLDQLQKLGVRIAIDDFGTGY